MKAIHKIFLSALAVTAFSCDDIIEEDITKDIIQVISPLEGAEIESNVASLQWHELADAEKYRVQVYGSNQTVMLDSTVTATRVVVALQPGHYQWRVRAENSAYQSSYSFPMGFTMIASDNLANQQVILNAPGIGIYTNDTSLIASWQQIAAALTYEIELTNTTSGNVEHQQSGLVANTFTFTSAMLEDDGQYTWKVRAVNASSQTLYTSRNFYIDRIAPSVSTNVSPANNSTQQPNIQLGFSWSVPADNGVVASPVSYTIQLASDAAFTNILGTHANLTTAAYQEIFTNAGDYYWRVKTTDKAGNESGYSSAFKFTIN